jgi:hypothetical protein
MRHSPTALEQNLCLDFAYGQICPNERISMQNGSVIRAERQRGPDVWEFRWREPGADGKRRHRRIVLGSVEQLADEAAARQAVAALRLEFSRGGAWLKTRSATVFAPRTPESRASSRLQFGHGSSAAISLIFPRHRAGDCTQRVEWIAGQEPLQNAESVAPGQGIWARFSAVWGHRLGTVTGSSLRHSRW